MTASDFSLMIFDDGHMGLNPLARFKASFELAVSPLPQWQRIARALEKNPKATWVPATLRAVVSERHDLPVNPDLSESPDQDWLVVNGSWNALDDVQSILDLETGQGLLTQGGRLFAARVPASSLSNQNDLWSNFTRELETTTLNTSHLTLDRPSHVMELLSRCLPQDLASFDFCTMPTGYVAGMTVVGDHPVKIHPTAKLIPAVTFDTIKGPIVIDAHAELRPFVSIQGPVYVGPEAVIAAHTSLRPNTVIGPGSRVGGEISHSIVGFCSNKAHDGYLGNAIVGDWCNLGASTTVSNLKNTYGSIRMQTQPNEAPVNTELTHLGPIIGDYTRTAIGTLIPTGAVIDVACMIATNEFVPKYVPPMAWLTDTESSRYDFDKLLQTLDTMMHRREVQLSEAQRTLLRQLAV